MTLRVATSPRVRIVFQLVNSSAVLHEFLQPIWKVHPASSAAKLHVWSGFRTVNLYPLHCKGRDEVTATLAALVRYVATFIVLEI